MQCARANPRGTLWRCARIARLLCSACALLLVSLSPGAFRAEPPAADASGTPGGLDPRYRMREHVLVVIQDRELNPQRVSLEEGQLVAWISYASVPSEIVFERSVARAMICHSLVNFAIRDDELRSAPIRTGEFASFCELKPGRYQYRVVRETPAGSEAAAAQPLEGEIVVGGPAGG
ncbi:MAG: hypothetical protein OEM49_10315 [Myxococcales bacterium]|nr:hypothetical protein [Myxococcales bacterium]MDH5307060.1 hypothetical protein [Myxococcales bacterium]